MEQWISAGNAYYDRDIVRSIVLERLVAPRFGREPDEAKIAEAGDDPAVLVADCPEETVDRVRRSIPVLAHRRRAGGAA